MAKAWARLIVVPAAKSVGAWRIILDSDLGCGFVDNLFHETTRAAITRARAWSRRLGGIPVEVEE